MIEIEEEYVDFIKSEDYFSNIDYFLQYIFRELCFDKYVKIDISDRSYFEDRVVLSFFLKYNDIKLPIGKFIVDKNRKEGKFNQQFSVDDINFLLCDFSSIDHVEYEVLIESVKKTFEYKGILLSHKIKNEDIHCVV